MMLQFSAVVLLLTVGFSAGNQCTSSVCHLTDHSLRFFVLGDNGGQPIWPWYSPVQKEIGEKMEQMGTELNTHFQVELGDNFYYFGVTGVHDTRWQDTFENIYHGPAMQRPWYVIAGNHDHKGNVMAEVAYSNISSRWVMPSLNYVVRYQISSGGQNRLVELVMIDTIVLLGNSLKEASWWDIMLGHDPGEPNGPDDPELAEQQWQWIEQQLSSSRADYLFVMGHFPVFSIAEHGPNTALIQRLLPLLHRYRVHAYMNGHDHDLQHFEHTATDQQGQPWLVNYVVSGAGSRGMHNTDHLHDERIPSGALKFHYPTGWDGGLGGLGFTDGGFAYIELGMDQGTIELKSKHGVTHHTVNLHPRH